MHTQEEYVEKGLKALNKYARDLVRTTLDEVVTERSDVLNHAESRVDIEKVMHHLIDFGTLSGRQMRSFLKHNQYYSSIAGFMKETLANNPVLYNVLPNEIDEGLDVPVNRILGNDGDFYMNIVEGLEQKGMFGENGSALDIVADRIFGQMRDVLAIAFYSKDHKNDPDMQVDEEHVFEDMYITNSTGEGDGENSLSGPLDESDRIEAQFDIEKARIGKARSDAREFEVLLGRYGLFVDDMEDAYKAGGITGTINHVISSTLEATRDELDDMLDDMRSDGYDLPLRSQDIIDAYTTGGLVGKGGVVDTVALANISMLSDRPVGDTAAGLKTLLGVPDAYRKIHELIRSEGYLTLGEMIGHLKLELGSQYVAEQEMSEGEETLTPSYMREIVQANGVFGEGGLVDHIAGEVKRIGSNRAAVGLMHEDDVDIMYASLNVLKNLHDPTSLPIQFETSANIKRYAGLIAQRSEELGVDEMQFLNDDFYLQDRKDLFVKVYESTDSYRKTLDAVDESIGRSMAKPLYIVSNGIGREDIEEVFSDMRPDDETLGTIYDDMVQSLDNETLPERISDYVWLFDGMYDKIILGLYQDLDRFDSLE